MPIPSPEPFVRRGRLVPATVIVLVLVVGASGCRSPGSGAGPPGTGHVTRVIDGDTVEVRLAGRVDTVRLLGIDTPETKHPTKPVQCYGKEASHRTGELLAPGTEVRLERDAEARDTYGRLLAYVYRPADGLFVNLELVSEGDASILSIAPNVAHADELRRAEDEARRTGRGLWGACGGPGRPAG